MFAASFSPDRQKKNRKKKGQTADPGDLFWSDRPRSRSNFTRVPTGTSRRCTNPLSSKRRIFIHEQNTHLRKVSPKVFDTVLR